MVYHASQLRHITRIDSSKKNRHIQTMTSSKSINNPRSANGPKGGCLQAAHGSHHHELASIDNIVGNFFQEPRAPSLMSCAKTPGQHTYNAESDGSEVGDFIHDQGMLQPTPPSPSISPLDLGLLDATSVKVPGTAAKHPHPKAVTNLEVYDHCQPLKPFARPEFPQSIPGCSPIMGVNSTTILRTCFRIGEAICVGAQCLLQGQDALIELYARMIYAYSNVKTTKQDFHLTDLFHDRPPYLSGELCIQGCMPLQEVSNWDSATEIGNRQMVRCLGRLRKDIAKSQWLFVALNIRSTDWQEVRVTKRIAGAGMMKAKPASDSKPLKRREKLA